MAYILAYKPDLEIKDENGYTPLHLAVSTMKSEMSTRTVRALLLYGAKRDQVTDEGLRPIELIPNDLPYSIKYQL